MNVEYIRELCKSKSISVRQLEIEIGIANGSICKWDRNIPSVDKAAKVAQYFNVPIDSLLEAHQ